MKRVTSLVLTVLFLSAANANFNLFAQDSSPAGTPLTNPLAGSNASGDTEPQFALSLLDEYFKGNEISRIKTGKITTAIGAGVFILGGAAAGISFLAPSSCFSSDEEQKIFRGVAAGTAGMGVLIGGIGLAVLSQPKDKYLSQYAYLYAENDPVVQEALAYGIMKDIADDAKRNRITGGIIGVLTPVAVLGGQAIFAGATDDWEGFKTNAFSSLSWTLPNLVSGLVMLIGGTSKEERLLETYRVTGSAYAIKKK